jgi:hypothetical protein
MALVSADAHLPTHGGLTPAAPGNVRSCIAKGVISPANDRAAIKSGGRQPPVECTQRTRTRSAEIRRIGIADGVYKPTAGSRPPLLVLCVRASQTSFFSPADVRTPTQERGASAPRGANKRECNGNPHTHRRRSADEWRSCLPMRICPPTAGLRPPLLVLCVVHRKHRFFAGRHSHANTRAGGVSPPWPAIVRDRTNRRNTSAAGNRIRTSDQLRGASAPRGANKRECNGNPHTLRRRSADEWRSCLPMRICPPTAGLRPPLLVRHSHSARALTPAALVTCVRASQTSFFRRQTSAHQHKSGGASAPRGMYPAHANSKRRNSSHWNCKRGLQTHGGLTPAALGCVDDSRRTLRHSPRTARVMRTTAGSRPPLSVVLTTAAEHYAILLAQRASCEPRRAYARRSWYCAFVHRKRRYFTGERSCCNQERGASAPRGRPLSETQRTGGTQASLAIASAHPTGKKRTLNANGCIEGRSGRNHLKSSLSIHPAKPIGVSSRRTFRDNRDSEGRPYICRNR